MLALGLAGLRPAPASAFPHVVQSGETLASIAEKTYGIADYEKVIVRANRLDGGAAAQVRPGMLLELPAHSRVKVARGETWESLALRHLGDASRGGFLATANDASPWMALAEGVEIAIPYHLAVKMGPGTSLVGVAKRFMGAKEKAWTLDRYNHLKGKPPKAGRIVLVPLTRIRLTADGQAEARRAAKWQASQATPDAMRIQRNADRVLPNLMAHVRNGRYAEAISVGVKLQSGGQLTRPQAARVHRQLLEAYSAMGATGLARVSCNSWLELDESAVLDPDYLSPKILKNCPKGRRGPE